MGVPGSFEVIWCLWVCHAGQPRASGFREELFDWELSSGAVNALPRCSDLPAEIGGVLGWLLVRGGGSFAGESDLGLPVG